MSYRFVPQDAVAERWQDEWLSERKLGHRVHAFEGDTVILLPPTPASTFTQYFAFWLWGVFVPLYSMPCCFVIPQHWPKSSKYVQSRGPAK